MITTSNKIKLLSAVSLAFALTACGSDVDSGDTLLSCDVPMIPSADGQSCVAPQPIQCPAPTVPDSLNEACIVGYNPELPEPIVTPDGLQAVLFYNRIAYGASNNADDASYEGYKLHTWNNDQCDAYASTSIAPSWDNGLQIDGIDPTYGAYWILDLKEGYGECANFIIHLGVDDAGKAMGSGDFNMPLFQEQGEGEPDFSRMNFTFHAEPSIFEYPVDSLGKQPVKVSGNAGHWIDLDTLAWNIDPTLAPVVKLHYSMDAGIEADEDDNVNGTVVELTAVEQSDEQKAAAPATADWPAYMGDWDEAAAKAVLKGQAVLVGYNADDVAVAATGIQTAKVLDVLYTSNEMDADDTELGLTYDGDMVNVALWAPTAQQVTLKIFNADKIETASHAMTENTDSGVWSYAGDKASLDRQFYQYEVVVYHQDSQNIETLAVTDPYSVGLSTNGMYSQFVNLSDDDLFPEGWDTHQIPVVENYEDIVVYEGHIRDFSARDESVTAENRGKYLAFTEMDSAPVQHLQKLANAGVTHFHMLPANDIASINEDNAKIVNIDDTIADLCALNKDAAVCTEQDGGAIIADVLASYSPYSNEAAELVDALRGYDSFNWGYDPKHFNVPDGVYASDADGVARIKEMRAMIQGLHETGLRAVLDVVYNHTNSAGLYDNSVFDKVVPGYYHHRDVESGAVIQSTCCNNTALENRMMDKFMVDSLSVWAEHYGFDGFRFDIMSQGYKDQMVNAREAVRAIDPDTYFYGEGWHRTDRDNNTQANQFNMAGTEISTFNDRLRDGIRNGYVFQDTDDVTDDQDTIKFGMAGSLADFVLKNKNGTDVAGSKHRQSMYAKDPADVVNYISKHDNETLWDQLQLELPRDFSLAERVRVQNVSHGIVMLSQGVPFLQLGGDFLRSKSLDRNTYDAGDWYNLVDFTMMDNNFNKGLPIDKGDRNDDQLVALASSPDNKPSGSEMMFASDVFNEFTQIRKSSPLFRLTTADDIINRVGFHNIGSGQTKGLVVMSIDDGLGLDDLDMNNDAIVVVANMSMNNAEHTVVTAAGFELHSIQQGSVDGVVAGASFTAGEGEGTFNVPAQTVAVFVKPQGEAQGEGLAANATAGAPDVKPYGDAVPLVRGDMNGWGENLPMEYIGDGVYRILVTIDEAKTYGFKLATSDWSTIDLGGIDGDTEVLLDEIQPLSVSGPNLSITFSKTGTYFFDLNAKDTDAPTLTVSDPDVFAGTPVYIRGDMNGWGEVDVFTHNGDGTYKAIINITEAKSYGFKVASGDWSTFNFGAPAGDSEVTIAKQQILVAGSNDNFAMEFVETGEYTFSVDMTLAEPIMTVHKTEMYAGVEIFLKGTISSWDALDEYKLSYLGDSTYEVELDIAAGSYEFKIADADWTTINIGSNLESNEAMVGTPYLMQLDGNPGNIFIDIAEDGTYLFTLEGPNNVNPHVTVTQVL